MSKLLDMFAQARRAQGGSGMGFLGKNRQETKPRAAAIVIELATADASNAEAALKAGADGLLFTWDGKDTSWPETLKSVTEAAQASNEKAVSGLRITGGWDTLTRERLEQIDAPASLLAQHIKDLDLVVTVPMREGELYPIFIRNLTAFDNITAVQLDFGFSKNISKLSIEDILQYRAVREAVRYPALLSVTNDLSESDAYTLITIGVQAILLSAKEIDSNTKQRINDLRELLEKIHQEDKDSKLTSIKS